MVVLIVEDDPVISVVLEMLVEERGSASPITVDSRADAFKEMRYPIDFAILDVDVTNGKTFDVAAELHKRDIPFVFVSGSDREDVPETLRHVPFVPKPFDEAEIKRRVAAIASKTDDARRREP